ncbi:MAG: leucyl/phenylalanyl-tRNA--protein transferase [Proteobacteria bacterium]|nr:leucyl/phenylalanyl-tRNA--protein transferase [Pseudomonadota bacterium]
MTFYYRIPGLRAWRSSEEFPPVAYANRRGLLCFGGAYDADLLYRAYSQGIFPWPDCDTERENGSQYEIPWFSPDPRFVLYPDALHVSHSLKKTLRRGTFQICADRNFEGVIRACAAMDRGVSGGWLTEGLMRALIELHRRGIAHSIESYQDGELVGGLYGLCIGRVFVGESMFTTVPDSSKAAFVTFVRRASAYGIGMIDCEDHTDNLERFGARFILRGAYLAYLQGNQNFKVSQALWTGDWADTPYPDAG